MLQTTPNPTELFLSCRDLQVLHLFHQGSELEEPVEQPPVESTREQIQSLQRETLLLAAQHPPQEDNPAWCQ